MEFKLVQQIVGNIQSTIENVAVATVNALKAHTFRADVKVKNFPKNQKISGIVSVSNQKRVEAELKKATTTQKTILKWLKKLSFPSSIKVDNFPEFPKFPEFPTSIKVDNFPKFPEFPKNFRVSNQPTKELKEIAKQVKDLQKALKKIKLDPKINVEAAKIPDINVPEPRVTVTQKDIDYEKLASLIPVSEGIDYDKLAERLAKELGEMVVSIGGGGSSSGGNSFYDRQGRPARAMVDAEGRVVTHPDYFIADKEVGNSITYTGNENPEGAWYMMKIEGDQMRYASSTNNTGYKDYAEAWDDRANLTYDYPSKVSF